MSDEPATHGRCFCRQHSAQPLSEAISLRNKSYLVFAEDKLTVDVGNQEIACPREHFAFAREQKRFAREHFTFAREQKRFARKHFTFAREEKRFARKHFTFAHAEKRFAREHFTFAREQKRFPRCRRTGVVFRRSVHPPADPSTARRNRIGPLLIQGNTAAFADPELVPTHTTLHRARC